MYFLVRAVANYLSITAIFFLRKHSAFAPTESIPKGIHATAQKSFEDLLHGLRRIA
jgi:hypothetical protein